MLVSFDTPDSGQSPDIFIRSGTVEKLTGVSAKQRKRWEAVGKFPKSIMIGSRTRVWLQSEIYSWMQNHVARRDARMEKHIAERDAS